MIVYGLTIALQLSGALLLMCNYWGNVEKATLKEYFPGRNIAERNEKNEVCLERDKLIKCASKIYLTRISFTYIVLGYLINLFGTNNVEPCVMLFYIIGVTVGLCALAFFVSCLLAKWKFKDDKYIDYDTLAEETEVDTIATVSEIDALFEEKSKLNKH